MRICFSAGGYPSKGHPYTVFISALTEKFTEKGHQVTVIAPQSITHSFLRNQQVLPYHTSYMVGDAEINIYRPKCITFGNHPLTFKMQAWAFQRCYKRLNIQFDIIYAHMWASGHHALSCAIEYQIPLFVASGEDVIDLTRYISPAEILMMNKWVKGVVCVSTKNKKESIQLGLTDEQKCIVLPNGIDMDRFKRIDKGMARQKLKYDVDDFIIAYVGRFIYRKGANRVVKAILELKDEKIKSIFIGSTMPDEDKEEEPIYDGILYKGLLAHEDIPLYLSAADIYVLPTLAEGCSNSIVEALSCGLPVVSSDLDFNYDVLNSKNAILVDPMNITEIAASIKYLKEHPQQLSEMSKNALLTAKKLDYNTRVERILEFINSRTKLEICQQNKV